MAYGDMSPLSGMSDDDLLYCSPLELVAEITLFRKALQYCKNQEGDDNCWMDYRHMLMRFLPGYDPAKDDVVLAEDQKKNCDHFIECWQKGGRWDCLGGDKGKTIEARTIGTLDCLEDTREVFNFIAIGWTSDYTVYFGVGLTKEQAWERFKEDHPDFASGQAITFDNVKEIQASDKFAAYDIYPAE